MLTPLFFFLFLFLFQLPHLRFTDYNYEETMSTLKYANRAKSIENAVVRNEDMNERMIKGTTPVNHILLFFFHFYFMSEADLIYIIS